MIEKLPKHAEYKTTTGPEKSSNTRVCNTATLYCSITAFYVLIYQRSLANITTVDLEETEHL